MMRRATGISIGLHVAALVLLLSAAVGESAPPPPPPQPMAVALAPLPAPKPEPAPAPKPDPVPVEQPKPAPTPKPQPPKPVAKPAAKPAPTPATTGPALENAPAPTPAPVAEAAPPSAPAPPPAPPAPAASTPDALWLAAVRAKLEAAKRYPAAALRRRDEGTATISMEVSHDGRVLSHALTRSSGSALLDREAESLPERVSPLPPMPETMTQARITLVIPVSFALR